MPRKLKYLLQIEQKYFSKIEKKYFPKIENCALDRKFWFISHKKFASYGAKICFR